MHITDSHTHLTSKPIYENLDFFINNFETKNGVALLNLAYNLESIYTVLQIQQTISTTVKVFNAIGLHPELFININPLGASYTSYDKLNKVINTLKDLFKRNKQHIHAVGEIGLDYYQIKRISKDKSEQNKYKELQRLAFRKQIEIAKEFELPVSIHTRDNDAESECIEDTLTILAEVGEGSITGSFHSYTGPSDYISDIINYGFYIGYNGIVTYKNAENVRSNLKLTPVNRILLESDAPYLPPEIIRKDKKALIQHGQPADVVLIADYIANYLQISLEKLAKQTTTNFYKFLQQYE